MVQFQLYAIKEVVLRFSKPYIFSNSQVSRDCLQIGYKISIDVAGTSCLHRYWCNIYISRVGCLSCWLLSLVIVLPGWFVTAKHFCCQIMYACSCLSFHSSLSHRSHRVFTYQEDRTCIFRPTDKGRTSNRMV